MVAAVSSETIEEGCVCAQREGGSSEKRLAVQKVEIVEDSALHKAGGWFSSYFANKVELYRTAIILVRIQLLDLSAV